MIDKYSNLARKRRSIVFLAAAILLALMLVLTIIVLVQSWGCLMGLDSLLASGALTIALPSITAEDQARPWHCSRDMVHDGDKWKKVHMGLWFQPVDAVEEESPEWQVVSNELQCDEKSLSCTLNIMSMESFTSSLSWGGTAGLSFGLAKALGMLLELSFNISFAAQTATMTSYSCAVPANHTVMLAVRPKDYLVIGYASELDWEAKAWNEYCTAMMRLPMVGADGSISGKRRCIVAQSKEDALLVVDRLQSATDDAERDLLAPLARAWRPEKVEDEDAIQVLEA